MRLIVKSTFFASLIFTLPLSAHAFDLRHGSIPVQLGYFASSQGKAQNINIEGLVGNQYTVNNHVPTNGLFGIGYYVDGLEKDRFQLSYGINGFYLPNTGVGGTIIQEHLFSNLAYNYKIQNIPIYFGAKAMVKTAYEKYTVTLDAGIGPNFMRTSEYNETPIDPITLPDSNSFAPHNNVTFTAMAGIGLRLNHVFGKAPLECGYRFFYLGQGHLQINNNQILNTINTGDTYANALLCSIVV